jgi:HD-like signal output (HDOD) protein/DNA-binding response OmpR family regulator
MTLPDYRALIVDDEAVIRQLTMRALAREGFSCNAASDGNEALALARGTKYDVVVTDLRMPNKHGHALALDLLQLPERPLIVVLTGVIEPRLAKDLVSRGVDDIMFKPVDYPAFAGKVSALVKRRAASRPAPAVNIATAADRGHDEADHEAKGDASPDASISLFDLESKLTLVSRILPISQAALEVFNLASENESSSQQLAAAIQRDPSLTAELLGLANSSYYNPAGRKIMELEAAVTRLGQKRVGELALATNAMSALTAGMLPWMDAALAWRRSIAAGVAVELLVTQGGHQSIEQGLLLSAIMHSLGRVVLGTLYPRHYARMIKTCRDRNAALLTEERRVFPENHAAVMSRLLAVWKIPEEVCQPLRYILDEYPSLTRLSSPLRTKVELIKLAVLIGQIAAGDWEPWDHVEFPSSVVLKRLGIHSLRAIIEQTSADSDEIITFQAKSKPALQSAASLPPRQALGRRVAYCNLSGESFDFMAQLLPAMGIESMSTPPERIDEEEHQIVNCIASPSSRLAALVGPRRRDSLVIITDTERLEKYRQYGHAVAIPTSFSALRAACWDIAHDILSKDGKSEDASRLPQQVFA